jgi:hypothetical protein
MDINLMKAKKVMEHTIESLQYTLGKQTDEIGILKDKLHIANDHIMILEHHNDILRETIYKLQSEVMNLEAGQMKKFTSIDEAYENEYK